jgi:glycosyltransferase involved in cell wall biosynthesis
MGNKNKNKAKNKAKKVLPFVSICTPTFNRRPFIQTMLECFKNQTYPKDRIEWIIVDDGTDKIKDLIDAANIPQIKYFPYDTKMTLGKKRNIIHDQTKGDIMVYMDDDDYYPPERVEHAVDMLSKSKHLCAGTSELYVYFNHLKQMWQCGPYGPNHATAGTFAFKRELLSKCRYNETACIAEEREFLHGYTIPVVQLDPTKTILVFSHDHNTFDKRKLLINPHPDYMKVSNKTVEKFIRKDCEELTKHFFTKDMDIALKDYAPGQPVNKPDVLVQTKEIEEKRNEMERKAQQQKLDNGPITLQEPGKEPVVLKNGDIIKLINGLRDQLKKITTKHNELLELNGIMHNKLMSEKIVYDEEIKKLKFTIEELKNKLQPSNVIV